MESRYIKAGIHANLDGYDQLALALFDVYRCRSLVERLNEMVSGRLARRTTSGSIL